MKLYGHPLSGNSHRAHALLSILGVDYEDVVVDLMAGAHKQPDFLAMNPLGQVPVLVDGDVIIRDSVAILVYIARKHDSTNQWLPQEARAHASVQQWLSIATHEIQKGPFQMRLVKLLNAPFDYDGAKQSTENTFGSLFEPHLSRNDWLVGEGPTIADLANYAYIARAPEGDFSLEPYPAIRAWLKRIESLNNFHPMVHAAELFAKA